MEACSERRWGGLIAQVRERAERALDVAEDGAGDASSVMMFVVCDAIDVLWVCVDELRGCWHWHLQMKMGAK